MTANYTGLSPVELMSHSNVVNMFISISHNFCGLRLHDLGFVSNNVLTITLLSVVFVHDEW